ncbi:uncharacterized protein LOC114355089 [Ostrinia furnacalis]|uniref:uncharacterized protein LOC114355089 n=1 Tax=Ostrinia furnacalis TaxID=93504 RepID=UPI00103C5AE2|nr:uncharacterized protein LOC114355089 [Ostrinia furnacalis]
MIRLGDYTFSLNKNKKEGGPKQRWLCTRWSRHGCRGSIITIENMIAKYNNGKPMIRLGDYHFSLNTSKGPKRRWICSKWAYGCRASIMTLDNQIIKINNYISLNYVTLVIIYRCSIHQIKSRQPNAQNRKAQIQFAQAFLEGAEEEVGLHQHQVPVPGDGGHLRRLHQEAHRSSQPLILQRKLWACKVCDIKTREPYDQHREIQLLPSQALYKRTQKQMGVQQHCHRV